ncbi:hypothetical protein S7711_07932 [Stachybotrys chartarum IBT 7711]|uniref:Anaphase-promoting complex subunit 4 WD40 domain-containing protein n=1 Tax=Stachybotrys chartarum (strain CBS 109288 / IBT 7711) TaxID=1280523 RepID=A0A084AKS1_STACB|nr:hypothetical protein S7711_07932 [Stachybotrys chartarum IBT 7711]KFA55795.1 hypothetical protein S40293_01870 [Stachybotrys chartarum IBT 40293]
MKSSLSEALASEQRPSPALTLTLTLRYRRQASKAEVTAVGISPSTSSAFAVSLGCQAAQSWVDVFDIESQRGHSKTAGETAAFSPKGDRIACLRDWTTQVGGGVEQRYASTVLIRDAVSGKTVVELKGATSWPLAWSRDGRYLAAGEAGNGFASGRMSVWDTRTGTRTGRIVSHLDTITHAVFTPDNNLVTQSLDGTVRLSNPTTSKTLRRLEVESVRRPHPRALAVSADGSRIASVWASTVQLWLPQADYIVSYATNAVRRTEGWPLCVSPDGQRVACWTEDGFDLMDVGTGAVLCEQKTDMLVTAGAFSTDGKVLLLGRMDGMLEVWDVEQKE